MQAKLIPFPHAPEKVATPLPSHHQPGDSYLRVELTDDALDHMGLFAGAVFIALRGALWDRLPHAVEFDGEIFLGVLRILDPKTVEFFSWHQGECAGVYELSRLNVIGPICDEFPLGDAGPRRAISTHATPGAENLTHGSLLKTSVK
jgi:hypothetical protein